MPNQIVDLDCVTTVKWLTLWKATYKLKNKHHSWFFVSRQSNREVVLRNLMIGKQKADAVSVVPFFEDCLVVIREFRAAIGGYEYSFPAGLLEENESPEEAGIRELREETGLTCDRMILCSPPVFSSVGLTDECLRVVFCVATGKITTQFTEEQEDIEIILVPRHELSDLCFSRGKYSGVIHGARSWSIILMLMSLNPQVPLVPQIDALAQRK